MSSDDSRRAPLNRERVIRAAIAMADEDGIDALSMRKLAGRLDVVPMALYKHVSNKEELLDGMVEQIVGEIPPPDATANWKASVRGRVLAARETLLSHRWAPGVIESRRQSPPVVLRYMDSLIASFFSGGLSVSLTHHAMHALGSRMWGFTQEVFPTPEPPKDPGERAAMFARFEADYPHIVQMATAVDSDPDSSAGGCDARFEFEFALDLFLDGVERLHERAWSPR